MIHSIQIAVKQFSYYISFKDILHTNEGCVLQFESKYKNIMTQCKQAHGNWHNLSESSTQTNIFPDITEVEVNHLAVLQVYEFRGLFEETATGEIVQLYSKEGIAIKSKYLPKTFSKLNRSPMICQSCYTVKKIKMSFYIIIFELIL